MTQHSYLQNFTEHTVSYMSTSLLEPICDWIKNNPGEEVTPEVLIAALNLPEVKTTSGRATPKTQSIAATSKGRRRKETGLDRPQCKWKFVRGAQEGLYCPNPCAEGLDYCNTCKHKKTAGGQGRQSKAKTGDTKAAPKSKKGSLSSKAEVKEKQQYQLDVDELGKSEDGFDLFLDIANNYVIKDDGNQVYTIVGIYDRVKKVMGAIPEEDRKELEEKLDISYEEGVTLASTEEEESF